MPRKRVTFTDEQVRQVEQAAALMTVEQMADVFDISARTFHYMLVRDRRVFAAYKKGRAQAIAAVGFALLRLIERGNLPATVFYLKCRAGWTTTSRREVVDAADHKKVRGPRIVIVPVPASLPLVEAHDDDA